MINLPSLPSEKTSQNLVRNIVGYTIMALAGTVITLFALYNNMQSYVRKELMNNTTELKVIIEKNNTILHQIEFTFRFKDQQQREYYLQGEINAASYIDSVDKVSKAKYNLK